MMKIKLISLCVLAAALAACGDDSREIGGRTGTWLIGGSESVVKDASADTFTLPAFIAADEWQASVSYDDSSSTGWLTLDKTEGTAGTIAISATVAANTSLAARGATVTVTCHDDWLMFRITQTAGSGDDSDDDPVDDDSKISSITFTYYGSRMEIAYTEELSISYDDAGLLSEATYTATDATASESTVTAIAVAATDAGRSYTFTTGGEAETVAATIADGRYTALGDMAFGYLDGNLYYVSRSDTVWSFSWQDSGISSISCNYWDNPMTVRMSEFAQTGNLSVNAVILACLDVQDNLKYAVMAEKGLWGNTSSYLFYSVTSGTTVYTYNAELDSAGRLSKVLEYRRAGTTTSSSMTKRIDIVYME